MGKFMTIIFILIIGIMFAPDCRGDVNIDMERTIMNRGQSSLTISPGYGNTPLYFIPNKGQVAEKALFYAKTPGYTLWLIKKGLVFDSINTPRPPRGHPSREGNAQGHSLTHQLTNSSIRDVSHLVFIGANSNPEIVPVDMTRHRVNYFMGKDKSKWRHNIPTSKAVRYKNIYENIDLKIYGIEKQIEYDWIVKSGGDPKEIRFEYRNVKSTHIDNNGDLIIKTEFGELLHKKPVSYQKRKAQSALTHPAPSGHPSAGGEFCVGAQRAVPKEKGQTRVEKNSRNPVEVRFKKTGKNTYGFSVGKYDPSRPLIIDPVVQLCYSTYLGGNRWECGYAITVDGSGCAFITGSTTSDQFPTKNPFQENLKKGSDIFITKLSPDGRSLVYSTYLGGTHGDTGKGIAVDSQGCAYVTGNTNSRDFPTQNPFQENYGGGSGSWHEHDAFLFKISPEGNTLLYSTYIGGAEPDYAYDITVDSKYCAYITGKTMSKDFPVKNAFQESYHGAYGMFDRYDAFVTKFSEAGNTLVFSTFLGGSVGDGAHGIAVDSSECVYITGFTMSKDFPTQNPFQGNLRGYCDAFVTKFSPDGGNLLYSTYLGGSSSDGARYTTYHDGDIAVDQDGCTYVTSWTCSTNFPTRNPFQAEHNGGGVYGADSFVTKLSPAGNSLEYSTYLGGSKDDYSSGIAVDGSGYAYITGWTDSNNFPVKNPFQGRRMGIEKDVFVTKLMPGGNALSYSTYLGWYEPDRCYGIAVDNTGDAYLTGNTSSPSFPTKNPFQGSRKGALDAFVTKLTDDFPPTVTITSPDNKAVVCGTVRVRAEASDDVGIDRVYFYIDGELIGSDNHAPYYYDWESFRFSNGNHAIKSEAVDTVEHKTTDEIMVKTQNVILTLSVERKQERAWLIRREYAKIDLNVNNPGSLVVSKYIISRRDSGGAYQPVKEIPGAEITGGSYSFNDTYLEKDKVYYYKAEAFDSSGDIIGITLEQSSQPGRISKKIITRGAEK